MIVKGTNEKEFLISSKTEKQLESSLRWRAVKMIFGGAALAQMMGPGMMGPGGPGYGGHGGMMGGGMMGGGMFGGYYGGGFGRAMEMGMAMNLGANLVSSIFR